MSFTSPPTASAASLYDVVKANVSGATSRVETGSNNALFVQFRNINYETRRNKTEPMTQILKGVSGYARPGAILCIMGPSGAGKTTLLNIIARKIEAKGDILINNEVVSNHMFKRLAAYVPQEDILMGSMSAREVMTFTADLLLPQDLSRAEKNQRVQSILNSLGLQTCADTPIGYVGISATHSGFKRGISGGERKRVSIGLELITNPKIIILDEPTSGLDSFSAKVVVSGLKTLAQQGRTVITTIHQPSVEIFVQFDDLLILAEGESIYFGDSQKSMDYFARVGYPCPPYHNPATHFLKILYTRTSTASLSTSLLGPQGHHVAQTDDDIENDLANVDKTQALHLIGEWKKAPESVGIDRDIPCSESLNTSTEQLTAPWWKQILWVFLRSMRNNLREPLMVKMRFGQSIFIAVVAGLIYLNRGHDQVDLHDRAAAMFFLILTQIFGAMNGPMFLFPAERAIFMREHSSGLYTTFNYYLGRCASDFPNLFIAPLVFAAISYVSKLDNERPRSLS
eukprot:TRINITY_DN107_c0_g3_i3.p1 TRINITY_DN107_c0_g3~~TRINITY_DN107_c0_g3_i3.p1  ORF type:complete len:513 (-),score=96.95 TRINITY_DN107_c0_g3_i3:972-2510(-)